VNDKPVITDFMAEMRDASRKARTFAQGMTYEQFVADEKTAFAAFAVVRALELVGEAAKQVPEDFRQNQPDVPWRTVCGMRDKLIHAYKTVDYAVV